MPLTYLWKESFCLVPQTNEAISVFNVCLKFKINATFNKKKFFFFVIIWLYSILLYP